jgi:hypothetical protein
VTEPFEPVVAPSPIPKTTVPASDIPASPAASLIPASPAASLIPASPAASLIPASPAASPVASDVAADPVSEAPAEDPDDGSWDKSVKFDLLIYTSDGTVPGDGGSEADARKVYGDTLGSLIIASPSNLKSKLASSRNYVLSISAFAVPTGEGEDTIDLSVFSDEKIVEIVDARSIEAPSLRGLSSRKVHPVVDAVPIPITGGAKTNDLIHYLVLGGPFAINGDVEVQSVYFDDATVTNAKSLTTGYALVPFKDNSNRYGEVKLTNLGLLVDSSNDRPSQIDFGTDKWTFHQSGDRSFDVATTSAPGYVSVIYPLSRGETDWVVVLNQPSSSNVKITPLNLTLQKSIRTWFEQDLDLGESRKKGLADPVLRISFLGDWTKVTDHPEFVFQGPTKESVIVTGAPASIKVTTQAVKDHRPAIPVQGDGGGGGGDDDGGLSGGAIAGIVIGVLAAVGIAGFCVWYFVLRPKKQGVEGTKP